MARIAEARQPALPVSARQTERWDGILDAAADLGSRTEYDMVQMQEVARAAGVALRTLYRYFPSKPHLFTALFDTRVARFVAAHWPAEGGPDPVAAVSEHLAALTWDLLRDPCLCASMLQGTVIVYVVTGPAATTPYSDETLSGAMLRLLGEETPDPERRDAVRLLIYSWWGVLVSCLSGKTTQAEVRTQIDLAVRRLLA